MYKKGKFQVCKLINAAAIGTIATTESKLITGQIRKKIFYRLQTFNFLAAAFTLLKPVEFCLQVRSPLTWATGVSVILFLSVTPFGTAVGLLDVFKQVDAVTSLRMFCHFPLIIPLFIIIRDTDSLRDVVQLKRRVEKFRDLVPVCEIRATKITLDEPHTTCSLQISASSLSRLAGKVIRNKSEEINPTLSCRINDQFTH